MTYFSSALNSSLFLAVTALLLVACNPAPANNYPKEATFTTSPVSPPLTNLQTNEQVPLGQQYTYGRSGLSLQPPKDWIKKEISGLDYVAFVSDATNTPSASIALFEEASPSPMDEYIKINIGAISQAFEQFKEIGRSEFKTNSDIVGVAIALDSEQLGRKARQIFYFFSGKDDKKIVFTCSFLTKDSEKLAPLCAASLQTLKFGN
ncbi:MAG: hypothetical protein HC770_10680 [Pseudanabaena sp. CRU_2_10]|nr:hypothetical protein [Pseudanabaena sp. CRU_2_10]